MPGLPVDFLLVASYSQQIGGLEVPRDSDGKCRTCPLRAGSCSSYPGSRGLPARISSKNTDQVEFGPPGKRLEEDSGTLWPGLIVIVAVLNPGRPKNCHN